MTFALLLLSAVVAVSHQQLRQYPSDRMYWLAPYYPPQSTAVNSYYLPAIYDNEELDTPLLRQLQDNKPDIKEDYTGIQPRKTNTNRYQSPQNNARFIIRFSTGTKFLNKVNTITFTLTSSVTFTNVQSCIPSARFSDTYANVVCRRKRSETVESPAIDLKDNPFAIDPLIVQQVEPTVISPFHPLMENVELPLISSSKDEDFFNEMQSPQQIPSSQLARMKRLFFHLVTTTTVVSYSFFTVTNTKTVNLVAVDLQLICRPEGYSICSGTSSFSRTG